MAPRNVFENSEPYPPEGVVISRSTSRTWRSQASTPEDLDTLHEGVPEWMLRPLAQWIVRVTRTTGSNGWGNEVAIPDLELLQEYEIATRSRESLITVFREQDVPGLYAELGDEGILDFLDFLVFKQGERGYSGQESLRRLEELLTSSGSAWTIGTRDDHTSLEKRVPEGVKVAVDAIMTNAGNAGVLLSEAWHAAFGRSPDPEEAYEKAIKAVEDAGASAVAPKSARGTLGTMIRDMKAQGDWKLPLSTSIEPLLPMAEALWTGQESRHGGNGYRKPTQDEAEAAVILAVALVQFFSTGSAARR